MKRIVKKIRQNVAVNRVVRNALKGLHNGLHVGRNLQRHWPVAGTVGLHVGGQSFQVYADCDDHIVNNLFYRAGYEESELDLFGQLITRTQCFVDVGANTGLYSLLAGGLNPAARVVAFEPHPGNYSRLVKNIGINRFGNVMPVQKAVGAGEGQVDFFIPDDGGISDISSLSKEFSENIYRTPFKKITVQVVSLDAFAASLPERVDLIKIDVEGFEYEVFQGACRIIRRDRPMILCEVFSAFCESDEAFRTNFGKVYQLQELLAGLGYSIYEIDGDYLNSLPSFNSPHKNRNYLLLPVKVAAMWFSFRDLAGLVQP